MSSGAGRMDRRAREGREIEVGGVVARWLGLLVRIRALIFVIPLAWLSACTAGESPFRQVQFCLNASDQIDELTVLADSIAESNDMKFVDRSAEATAEHRYAERNNANGPTNEPVIVISAFRRDGLFFGLSNIYGSPVQMYVSFFRGSADDDEANQFSDIVIAKLEQRWKTVPVPLSKGAELLGSCLGST